MYQACLKKKCVMMPMLLLIGISTLAFVAGVGVHWDYTRFGRRVWRGRGVLDAQGRRLSLASRATVMPESDSTLCSAVEKLKHAEVADVVANSVESDTPLDINLEKRGANE